MDLSLGTLLILVAVVAALMLVLQHRDRMVAAIALLAAGLEALIAFKVVSVRVTGLSLGLLLAAVLAVTGCICWARSSGKSAVTAATLIAVVGAIQVLLALRVID